MQKGISKGLVFVSDLLEENLDFSERIALENAKSVDADAVYFRKFPNEERTPIPQIYIFDYTTSERKQIWQLHKEVWSNGIVRIFYIITKTQVKIFNAAEPIERKNDGSFDKQPFKILDIVSTAHEEFAQYSAELFDSGTFWELHSNTFRVNQTAYEKLIVELKNARNVFLKKIKLSKATANKLLVLSILIKYLEERQETDEEGIISKVFSDNFFNTLELGYSDSLISVIRKGKLLKLFEILGSHFNGKIFFLDDTTIREIEAKQNELEYLAAFLSGKIDNENYVFWDLYSFNHLPVELISSVYEEFLEEEKGVVYTPPFLVNLLIDECMPISSNPPVDFKLLDPACGSGIFLVSAYKRLISWWRIHHFNRTGKWIRPNREHLDNLKKILLNSVFGVEIKSEAVDLTIFSLSLALCDILSPKVIWNDLRFDDLSNNIQYVPDFGFFKWLGAISGNKFDLIIGNPPFIEYNSDEYRKLKNDCHLELPKDIPQNQSALLFLQQAMPLVKPDGRGKVCLILPAGPLLYNNSDNTINFRHNFLSEYNIPQIIDFTLIKPFNKRKSQKDTSIATVALFAENSRPKKEGITHIVAKKLTISREKQYFEFDHYDFHSVSLQQALNNKFVWKANLLGGGKLQLLIERLSKIRTLGEFLTSKKKNFNWDYGDGFIPGKDDHLLVDNDLIKGKGKYVKAPFLTGRDFFEPENFNDKGITKFDKIQKEYFQWPRRESIFTAPLLVIKKNLGTDSIPMELFERRNIAYKNEVFGIHSTDVLCLKDLMNTYKDKNLFRFYLLTTSGRAGISRSIKTYIQEDILNLPYPENKEDLELSRSESIVVNDALEYYFEYLSKDSGFKIQKDANLTELIQFGDSYCFSLNSIYKDKEKQFHAQNIYATEQFFIYVFHYGLDNNHELLIQSAPNEIEKIKSLLVKQVGYNYSINKTLCLYDGDLTYYIKPKALKYWLCSVALRDADETFEDLIHTRYRNASK